LIYKRRNDSPTYKHEYKVELKTWVIF
jgi:hypothetical protein